MYAIHAQLVELPEALRFDGARRSDGGSRGHVGGPRSKSLPKKIETRDTSGKKKGFVRIVRCELREY